VFLAVTGKILGLGLKVCAGESLAPPSSEWPIGHAQPDSRSSGKNRPKSGMSGNTEKLKSHCEHKTIQNQHPSPCGEGYGDTLKRGCKGLLSLKKGSSGVVKRHHILLGFDAFQFSENLASSIKSSNSGVLEFCWPWLVNDDDKLGLGLSAC
jgi:hypothetical protein